MNVPTAPPDSPAIPPRYISLDDGSFSLSPSPFGDTCISDNPSYSTLFSKSPPPHTPHESPLNLPQPKAKSKCPSCRSNLKQALRNATNDEIKELVRVPLGGGELGEDEVPVIRTAEWVGIGVVALAGLAVCCMLGFVMWWAGRRWMML